MPPLRRHRASEDDENSPESPEALLISSYLEEGRFTPHKHRVEDSDIVAWRALWDLCLEYQGKTGIAPPLSLIRQRFPDFQVITDIKPEWAAEQVIRQSTSRSMRNGMRTALEALQDDDLEVAYTELDQVRRPRTFMKEATSVFDHSVISDRFNLSRLEVPYRTLMTATNGGIGQGEFWVVAARLAHGKSWEACGYGAQAAKAGARVAYASFEMPSSQVGYRTLLRMASRDPKLIGMLRSDEERERKEAADIIRGHIPGEFNVFDPGSGKINTTAAVRDLCEEYDLVLLDHIGLMQDAQGRRAMEDWRVMGTISNIVREITLETQASVLALAQISREGEKLKGWTPPKTSHISQSDAIGQDADVVITFKRTHTKGRVIVHSGEKVRDGVGPTWYTEFNPSKGVFHEISHDRAAELDQDDELLHGPES